MASFIGGEDLSSFLRRSSDKKKLLEEIQKVKKVPIQSHVSENNKHLATPVTIDLIQNLLRLDPAQRLSAKDALSHAFFRL